MNRGDYLYIWQAPEWPTWHFDLTALASPLAEVSRAQGLLLGRLADVGLGLRDQASLAALTDDVLKTSEIEGEPLNVASVRSSIARRLGLDIGALAPVDRNVEGVVDMVLDATTHCTAPLTEQRLFSWHAALFPTGYSGLSRIATGAWRDDTSGPMQVVSGPMGRQRVHFEAPPAQRLPQEMRRFLAWADSPAPEPGLIRAGLGHLWFVTLHPFDDGNGQIQRERKAYYDILERTQKGSLNVTDWLLWFLQTLEQAVAHAHQTLDTVLHKARFWQRVSGAGLNTRQVKVLNRLLDSFEGKLTSSKWAALAKCSTDTALRDLTELVALGVLRRSGAGGRSTSYELGAEAATDPIQPRG